MSVGAPPRHITAETRFVEAAIHPDSAHGFLFQYPTEVAAEIDAFLATEDARAGS